MSESDKNLIADLSKTFFNSGWQPLIGWTAGFLILIYYAPQLIIADYVWTINCLQTGTITPFPIKPDDILNLVWLLFGFGTYSLAKNKFISNS